MPIAAGKWPFKGIKMGVLVKTRPWASFNQLIIRDFEFFQGVPKKNDRYGNTDPRHSAASALYDAQRQAVLTRYHGGGIHAAGKSSINASRPAGILALMSIVGLFREGRATKSIIRPIF